MSKELIGLAAAMALTGGNYRNDSYPDRQEPRKHNPKKALQKAQRLARKKQRRVK